MIEILKYTHQKIEYKNKLDVLIIILLLTPLGIPMVPLGLPMVPMVPTFPPMVSLAPVVPLAAEKRSGFSGYQWYHWLPMVTLVKHPMVPLGESRTHKIIYETEIRTHSVVISHGG